MGNYEEAKEVLWRIDSLKGGVQKITSGLSKEELKATLSTIDSGGKDVTGMSPERGVRFSGAQGKLTRGHKDSHADHIELAGQKESTLSANSVQILLILLEEGKDKECFLMAQKLMETKAVGEVSPVNVSRSGDL